MLFPTITSASARIRGKVAAMLRDYRRNRDNARVVRYVERLPPHVLKDIGLSDVTQIAAAVDRGRDAETAYEEGRCAATIVPHAA